MSFKFDWSRVSTNQELLEQVKTKINTALREALSGNDNCIVCLRKLDLGSEPPELQIIKISELKQNKLHLVFAFSYQGNASMEMDINLQVNPLVSDKGRIGRLGRTHTGVLAAHLPLRAPIYTVLSKFQLDGTLALAIDMSTTEEEIITIEASHSSSLLRQSKEVITQKIRSLSASSKREKDMIEFSEVIKPKKKKEERSQVTLTLLNEAFRDVVVNSSFDGSPASGAIANSIKTNINKTIKKIIGTPQTMSFSGKSSSSSSSLSSTTKLVTIPYPTTCCSSCGRSSTSPCTFCTSLVITSSPSTPGHEGHEEH